MAGVAVVQRDGGVVGGYLDGSFCGWGDGYGVGGGVDRKEKGGDVVVTVRTFAVQCQQEVDFREGAGRMGLRGIHESSESEVVNSRKRQAANASPAIQNGVAFENIASKVGSRFTGSGHLATVSANHLEKALATGIAKSIPTSTNSACRRPAPTAAIAEEGTCPHSAKPAATSKPPVMAPQGKSGRAW